MFALLRLLLLFQMMFRNRKPSSWAIMGSLSLGRKVCCKGYFGRSTPDHSDWPMIITNSPSSFVIDATASYNILERENLCIEKVLYLCPQLACMLPGLSRFTFWRIFLLFQLYSGRGHKFFGVFEAKFCLQTPKTNRFISPRRIVVYLLEIYWNQDWNARLQYQERVELVDVCVLVPGFPGRT